jgi:hypothetical protein
MDLESRRELNNGFGDSLSRAFELAATPALFAGLGYVVDRLVGTQPIFMIVFLLWAVVAQVLLWWYRYDAQMKTMEDELLARRDAGAMSTSGSSQGSAERLSPTRFEVPVLHDGRLPAGVTLEDSAQ